MRALFCFFSVGLSFAIIGCSGTYKHTLNFDPAESLRVAVLPFVSVDGEGNIMHEEGRLLLDNLALVSSKQQETPPQIVRRAVQAELANTGLDIVSPALIDIDLPHHGFALSDGTIDIEKLLKTDPKELCSKFLDCDAVLYGKVTKWHRTYFGVQTVNTVGIELKLIAARTGKVLFKSAAEDTESRGITKIPTGISSVVLEPIRGLDSEIVAELSRNVVKKMLEPLQLKSRPEFLTSAPPVIYASSHDARSGLLKPSERLVVVAMGSEHKQTSFSIGSTISAVPMFERSPGHYYGEYDPLPGESFNSQPVVVSMRDRYGRVSTQQISQKPLSLQPSSNAAKSSK